MVETKPATSVYFASVAAMPGDIVALGGHLVIEEDDPTATLLVKFEAGQWSLIQKINDVINGICRNKLSHIPTFGAVGREGFFAELTLHGILQENDILRRDPSYIENISYIDGTYYACGGSNQVFMFKENIWRDIDGDIYVQPKGAIEDYLLSIGGFSCSDIFVCGSKGFLAHWDSRKWKKIDTRTNTDLNALLCTTDGSVYVCGGAGFLICMRSDGGTVNITDSSFSDRSFWDMEQYGDYIYIASENKLLRTDGHAIEDVPIPLNREPSIYSISAADSLWCAGDELLYQYKNGEWTSHLSPANK